MSFRELFRSLTTRSLYFYVFLAMVGTLLLSFFVFRSISVTLQRKHFDPVYTRLDQFQMESAVRVLQSDGPAASASYLARLDGLSGAHHYLLDARGIDTTTGVDRASLLPPAPSSQWRIRRDGHTISAQRSEDGRFWFATDGSGNRLWVGTFLPYYFLVISVAGVLCWLASIAVVSPVRRIATSIALFGQGDLSIRIVTTRQDEIGQLCGSFNQMAERLQGMIVSERRLLADISHELRSPLARLKFAVKLARTSADTEAALDRINRDIDRIASLVAGIVEITVAEGEPDNRYVEKVSIGDVLGEVIHDCMVEAEAHNCTIALHGRATQQIEVNRELLRRAVENVVRNAIRYSPEQTAIDVSVVEGVGFVTISVRDYGPGIPESALTKIFDPFFRVEESRDARGGGAGLGLSIAKRAIEVHKGVIHAENASPGLRVSMEIPLRVS